MNLLPPTLRAAAWADYHRRLLVVALGLAAAAVFLADILLVILAVHLNLEAGELAALKMTAAGEEQNQSLAATRAAVNRATGELKQLAGLTQPGQNPTDQLAAVLAARSAGVTFTSVVYSAGAGKTAGTIVIIGVAATRTDLLKLVAAYQQNQIFAKVNSPVENLVSEQGAPFTITLTLK